MMVENQDKKIHTNEVVGTPKEALDLLRRVPGSRAVSRDAFLRALDILEAFVHEQESRTQWI